MRKLVGTLFLLSTVYGPLPTALAQGECGLQTDPGNPETVICDPQDYPAGITYDSLGDLTLEVPDAAVDFTVNDDGINVTGNGADNIFWDSSAYTSGKITGTDGAVLDYLSADGDIDITVGGVIEGAGGSTATHAIRAEATGTGSVSVTTEGDVNPRPSGFFDPDPSGIGIEALTAGGDITIATVDPDGEDGPIEPSQVLSFGTAPYAIHAASSAGGNIDITTAGIVFSEGDATHGILAETTGAGAITLDTGIVTVSTASNPNIVAGIEARTDSGDISITVDERVSGASGVIAETGGSGTIVLDVGGVRGDARRNPDANGIRAITGSGNIAITSGGMRMFGGGTAIVTHTDGLATLDLEHGISGRGVTGSGALSGSDAAIRSSGGDVIVSISGTPVPPVGSIPDQSLGSAIASLLNNQSIAAPVDFTGLSGSAELNFNAGSAWLVTDPDHSGSNDFITKRSVFSPGDDVVNIAADAFLTTVPLGQTFGYLNPTPTADRFIVEFGAGQDVVNNFGEVYIAPNRNNQAQSIVTGYEGELRLNGLAEFNNAGTIWLGRTLDFQVAGPNQTDSWPDDVLSVSGATFHGEPGNKIVADVHLGILGQESCTSAARNADGDLLADCINLENGAATGRSLFDIRQMVPGDRGAYNPIGLVLVDLSGDDTDISATDPDAFGIHPDSRDYSPAQGGIIDKGLFFYTIALDPEQQQFRLYGFPSSGPQQAPLLLQAANDLWRTSAGAWFDRRVDQRDIDRDDIGGSIWGRTTRSDAERDVVTPILAGGEVLNFDNSYDQEDTTVTIGADFISRGSGDMAFVVGGMLGYAVSDIAFSASPNYAELRGMHVGLYGSLTMGDFYVDLAVNRADLDLDFDVPALALSPETALVRSDLKSQGGKIEAGWRWRVGRLSVEPLLGYSHVTTEGDGAVEIPADDPLRFGGAIVTDGDPTSSRGSVGVRLRLDDALPGIVPTSVGLTARAIEELDGESKIIVANIGPINAPMENTFDGTFGQVTGDISVTNTAKTLGGFLKVDGMFHDDYESLGVTAGFRAQW